MENNRKDMPEVESEKPTRFMTRMANLEKAKKDFEKRLATLERKLEVLIKSLRR